MLKTIVELKFCGISLLLQNLFKIIIGVTTYAYELVYIPVHKKTAFN